MVAQAACFLFTTSIASDSEASVGVTRVVHDYYGTWTHFLSVLGTCSVLDVREYACGITAYLNCISGQEDLPNPRRHSC